MKWKEWKNWLGEQPWILRWFVLLVLLRPVIDNFYFLKEVSPFLSPLYIVGALTPILCLLAIFKYRVRPLGRLDRFVGFWSASILVGCFLIFLFEPFSILGLEFVLKLSLPVYVYYFLRRLIRSERDLEGILQTVLYASVIVAFILAYELIGGPIRMEESRGKARIQGNFGDVVSYGIYIALATLSAGYFFFRDQLQQRPMRRATLVLAAVVAVSVVALVNMHHVASYTIFVGILGLFLLYNLRVNKAAGLGFLVLAGLAVIYFGQGVFEDNIAPLIETDMEVYAGNQSSERLLHGRVGRWIFMLDLLSEQSVPVQFFGYPLNFEYAYHYIGIGSHNDFVRMLFFTGILGLVLYLILLFQIYKTSITLPDNQRFLMLGLLMATVLYSISTTPTMYAPFIYVLMSGVAFIAIPPKKKIANG